MYYQQYFHRYLVYHYLSHNISLIFGKKYQSCVLCHYLHHLEAAGAATEWATQSYAHFS